MKRSNISAAKLIIIILVFFKAFPSFSQVSGCPDPSANNYDPSVTVNDGSCTYNDTNYTPPIIVDPISDTLRESSGLQWADNSLWSFNDRGGTPDLYRIDTASKAILQVVHLAGAENVDWEEVTFDGTSFYVGDFGNNLDGARTDLKIYKFPLSAIPDYVTNPEATISGGQIEIINFTYSDQVAQVSAPLDSTKFDCEAMIVADGKIHLFTKNWIDRNSIHYVIDSTVAGTYVATPLETLNTGYLVTGASKSPGKEIVTLIGYSKEIPQYHYIHLLYDYSSGRYFNGNKRRISLPIVTEMGQAEGITFRNDTYGYISNERVESFFTVNQKLRSFDISSIVPQKVLAIDDDNFNVNKINAADKITWSFISPVHNLEIQQSFDAIHFNVLKTYNISAEGSFYNNPQSNINYYRLAWKESNGSYQYSKIISIKNKQNNQISRLLLRANGELSFRLNGSREESFSFRLLTSDGKEFSRIAGLSYKPGDNKVRFANSLSFDHVVLLIAVGTKQKITTLLPVIR